MSLCISSLTVRTKSNEKLNGDVRTRLVYECMCGCLHAVHCSTPYRSRREEEGREEVEREGGGRVGWRGREERSEEVGG